MHKMKINNLFLGFFCLSMACLNAKETPPCSKTIRHNSIVEWIWLLQEDAEPEQRREARRILKESGSRVVPCIKEFVKRRAYNDDQESVKYFSLVLKAIVLLEENKELIIEQLNEMVDNEQEACFALHAMRHVGIDAMPKLINALGSKFEKVRLCSAMEISTFKEKAAQAVSSLVNMKDDPSVMVRAGIAEALGIIKAKPEVSVPGLISLAQESENPGIKFNAFISLGAFGRYAEDAIPIMKENLKHTNKFVRVGAYRGLKQINPNLVENIDLKNLAESTKND